MTVVLVILASIAGFAALSIAGGLIFFYSYARRHTKPLSPRELEACRVIVKRGRGHPFICALFVKDGKCGCLPCRKLEEELGAGR